jgi:hypothetical protein
MDASPDDRALQSIATAPQRITINGVPPHHRILYLELRQRHVSRGHAWPQPLAGSRRYGGGAEEPAPVPVGIRGHGPSWTPRTTPRRSWS